MKPVWKFTNQKELNKKQFINYIERKVFKTIRKYLMLPKSKIIILKKSNSLNTAILKKILQTKFPVKFSTKPTFSSDNLSQIAEDIFEEILKGNFNFKVNTNSPLQFISDKEINLYAKLTNTKGTKRKQNKKIQLLFERFLNKNQDLEINILKAVNQLNR